MTSKEYNTTYIRRLLIQASVIFCILSSVISYAKEVTELYKISVPVENQTRTVRQVAATNALYTVLSRISGRTETDVRIALSGRPIKSSNYIQRFQYQTQEVVIKSEKPTKQLLLDFNFDEASVRTLLTQIGLPRWGANRPEVLAWIAIGDQQQRHLLSDENLQQLILDKAEQRGLPLILPLMDLEDSLNVTVADVWGRFIEPLEMASARYKPDVIVAAQMLNIGDEWQSSWVMIHKDHSIVWESEGLTIEDALKSGLDNITDQIARQYAVIEDSLLRNELLISVTDIHSIEDYAYFKKYMEGLTSIHKMAVAIIEGDRFLLRVTLVGEQDSFIKELSLTNKLEPQSNQIFGTINFNSQSPSLFFAWMPSQ